MKEFHLYILLIALNIIGVICSKGYLYIGILIYEPTLFAQNLEVFIHVQYYKIVIESPVSIGSVWVTVLTGRLYIHCP